MNMDRYDSFIAQKLRPRTGSGIDVVGSKINTAALAFQRTIIRWAVRLGCCAVFADCGLGKSLIQLALECPALRASPARPQGRLW
mgnify:FL=1